MKGIINTIRLMRFGRLNGHILKMMEYQKAMIDKCIESNEPIIGKIEIEYGSLPIPDHPFLSFWVGVGDCTPFDRLRELREENDKLKRVLKGHNIPLPE